MTLEGGPGGTLLVSLNRRPVDARDLGPTLRDVFHALSDKTLFVRAVGPVRYGQVVDAMDTARGAGVERIGIMGAGATAAHVKLLASAFQAALASCGHRLRTDASLGA